MYISAFCGRTGRPTDKIFFEIEAHLLGESAQKEIGAISQLGAEKITFPPKCDGRTYGRTDIRTDISNYRVASLLKISFFTRDLKKSKIREIWIIG